MPRCVLALIDIAHPDCAVRLLKDVASVFDGAELHVAHVIPLGFYSYIEPYVSEESQGAVVEDVRQALAAVIARAGASVTEPHVLRGGVGEQAVLLARKIDASVVALNATRTGSEHTTLGTHAAQIARHAPCSVYLARRGVAASA